MKSKRHAIHTKRETLINSKSKCTINRSNVNKSKSKGNNQQEEC